MWRNSWRNVVVDLYHRFQESTELADVVKYLILKPDLNIIFDET